MKRSPLWFAAYVAAWRTLRDAARFVERREGERTLYDRVPLTPAEVAIECAKDANECEAGYVAAFGPIEDGRLRRLITADK